MDASVLVGCGMKVRPYDMRLRSVRSVMMSRFVVMT